MAATLYFVSQEHWSTSAIPGVALLSQQIGPNFGYTFPAQHRDQVIRALGWNAEQVAAAPTAAWGVDQLRAFSNGSPVADVQMVYHNDPGEAWCGYLAEVAGWFRQQCLDAPVRIHYAHGWHEPYANGELHVCFGGEANFGIQAWSHERSVRYQRGHLWIGELGPEHNNCRQLIAPLLQLFVPCTRGQQGDYQCSNLVAACARWVTQQQQQVEKQIEECEQAIRGLQKKLVEAIRRLACLQNQQLNLAPMGDNQQTHLQRLHQQLLERDFVRALTCADPILSIFTDRVVISISGHGSADGLYDIGEFRIDINTTGGDGCVKMFNLSRQVKGLNGRLYHHPHINQNGEPCLGTIKEVVPRFIAQAEYLAIADLLWNYLKATNPADIAGAHIVNWPRFSLTPH